MKEVSIYIHIPFCRHRCAYCDFNTYAGQEDSITAYVEALCEEIRAVGRVAPENLQIHTVFFGGGTPSLLSPAHFAMILRGLRTWFVLSEDAEITIEANPGSVTYSQLLELRGMGVNRISFGVQSANQEELRMLERAHDFLAVIEAVGAARKAGISNLNLDLIYGLPGQSLETWQRTLWRVLELSPTHISAYALAIEHGTPFGHWYARGLLPVSDPDVAADMYELAGEFLEAEGYRQYEISNWAKAGYECRHNLQYWRAMPYLGFGAGAHGYAHGYRYSNVLGIHPYVKRISQGTGRGFESSVRELTFPFSPAASNRHRQDFRDEASEAMLMGLRLTHEGITAGEFRRRFGRDLTDVFGEQIAALTRLGLLEWTEIRASRASGRSDTLRLTRRGRLLGNLVFREFV